jgi:hypothetical protein
MRAEAVPKDTQYLLNHCAPYLARLNTDERHSYHGQDAGQPRARISDAWRFPVVDSHDGDEPDAWEWNDVTFVYHAGNGTQPKAVGLLCTCNTLFEPVRMEQVEDTPYWTCSLKVRKGERHRYKFLVDGIAYLDPINPQTWSLPTGDTWSSFFTWAYNQPINFERWEMIILDRLTRHILPFSSKDAENFLQRGAHEGNVGHLYRLDVGVGVANFIDKLVGREERHRLYAYKTCLEMLDRILRNRHAGADPEFVPESAYIRLYDEMAGNAAALFRDGWDTQRYGDPSHFLYLLRRHAMTGAFAHPKYGGNAGGMAWAYLAERFTGDDGETAFNWRQAIEPPLGTSTEYRG